MTKARFLLAESIHFARETLNGHRVLQAALDSVELEQRVLLSASPLGAAPVLASAVELLDQPSPSEVQEIGFVDVESDQAVIKRTPIVSDVLLLADLPHVSELGVAAPAEFSASSTNQPPIISSNGGLPDATVAVFENGFVVTTVTATDPDGAVQDLTYSIDPGNDAADFSINGSSGILTFVTAPDFEMPGSLDLDNQYEVTVRVTDADGGSDSQSITVQVNDANEPITDIRLDHVLVPGGQHGTVVGNVTVQDPDANDIPSWLTDDVRFEVVGGQLKLLDGQAVDRTTEREIPLLLTATDSGGEVFSKSFILTVGPDPVDAVDDSYATLQNSTLTIDVANGLLRNDSGTLGNVVPGATLNYDAALDTNGDANWQDSVNLPGYDWALGANVSRNNNPTSNLPGILAAFDFDGATDSGGILTEAFQSLASDPTDDSASFEIWFRPDVDNQRLLLFESGTGAGDGISLRLNNRSLEMLTWTGGNVASVTHDLTTELAQGEFIQFIGTMGIDASGLDLRMYINGAQVGADLNVGGIDDWSDAGGTAALGTLDGNTLVLAPANNTVPFDGEIALVRFYEAELSPTEARHNFEVISGAAAALTAVNLDTTSDATQGLVSLHPDGSFAYDPNHAFDDLPAGATAIDRFRYDASNGSAQESAIVDITVTGVNDAPAATGFAATIAENTANGTQVGTIIGTDIDQGDTLTYSILDGDPSNAFFIDGMGNLIVQDAAQLDRETTAQFVLTIEVRDAAGLTAVASAQIDLVDENDVFPVVSANQVFNAPENAANGFLLGTVAATDADFTPTTFDGWSIVGGSTAFSLNPNTGELSVLDNTTLDFESGTSSYTLDVSVTDGTNTSLVVPITVSVSDVNEAPTVAFANVLPTVPDTLDTANSVKVADIIVSDDALGSPTLSLTGPDAPLFTIVDLGPGARELHLAAGASLDGLANPTLDITVSIDDETLGAGPEDADSTTITVIVTNTPPIAVPGTSSDYTVVEGGSIQLDGSLSSDSDGTVVSYEWDLDFDGSFNTDVTGANPVFDATLIDGPATRVIALRVIDDGGLVSSVSTTSVEIVNVAPIGIADFGTSFLTDEETPVQTGDATANDRDVAGDPLTIVSVDLTGTLGSVTIAADNRSFFYVPSPLYDALPGGASAGDTFTYTVKDDDGGITSSVPVTIAIAGRNDAPTASGLVTQIAENTPNGSLVGNVGAADVDVNDSLTYAITGGNISNTFSIDPFGNLLVHDAANLDRELISQFLLTVEVTDASGLTALTMAQISVTDENDVPPAILPNQVFSVDENAAVGTTLGIVVATDGDTTPGQFTNWMIVGGNPNGIFEIHPTSGELSIADNANLDFEHQPNAYQLMIRTSDGTLVSPDRAIQVTLNPLNDNYPTLATRLQHTVPENQVLIADLVAFDADLPAQTITYAIAGTGADDTLFTINANNQLVFRTPPDFDEPGDQGGNNAYEVDVIVNDGNGGTSTSSMRVHVVKQVEATLPPIAETDTDSRDTITDPTPTPVEQILVEEIPLQVTPNPGQPSASNMRTAASERDGGTGMVAESVSSALAIQSSPLDDTHANTPNALRRVVFSISTWDQRDKAISTETVFTVSPRDYVNNVVLWKALDEMGHQIHVEFQMPDVLMVSTTGVTSALTVGYVMWLLKGGHIMAGLLAQVPAWKLIDPLPIIAHLDQLGEHELEDDSLQTLMDKAEQESDDEPLSSGGAIR